MRLNTFVVVTSGWILCVTISQLRCHTHVPTPKLQTYICVFGQTPPTCYIQQVKQLVLSERRWRTPEDGDQGKHDRKKLSRLVDGDSDPEGMVFFLVVMNLDLYARGRSLVEFRQLLPQHLISRGIGVVVFGVNRHARIGRCGVDDNIAPPLVVVDAERNQEVVVIAALEAQYARAAAGRQCQDVLGTILTPGSFAKVGLLHDAVTGVQFGLDKSRVYCVRHVDKL